MCHKHKHNQANKKNSKGCELTMTNGNLILNPNIIKQEITKKTSTQSVQNISFMEFYFEIWKKQNKVIL